MQVTFQDLAKYQNEPDSLGKKTRKAISRLQSNITKAEPQSTKLRLWENQITYNKQSLLYSPFAEETHSKWLLSDYNVKMKYEEILKKLKFPQEYIDMVCKHGSGYSADEVQRLDSLAEAYTKEGYKLECHPFLKNYLEDAKKIRRTMKRDLRVINRDMDVTEESIDYFKRQFSAVKDDICTLKELKKFEGLGGLSKAAKYGIAGAAMLSVAGLCWGAYKLFSNKNKDTANNDKPIKQDNGTKVFNDSTILKQDSTAAVVEDTSSEELSIDTIMAGMVPAIDTTEVAPDTTNFTPFDYRGLPITVLGPVDINREFDGSVTQETTEENEVVITVPAGDETVKKENARAEFEKAVAQYRKNISTIGLESEVYTIVKGDSFWRIAEKSLTKEAAVKSLKAEGISNPTAEQIEEAAKSVEKPGNNEIVKRIALIAELNNIDKVTEYKLFTNHAITVPFSTVL